MTVRPFSGDIVSGYDAGVSMSRQTDQWSGPDPDRISLPPSTTPQPSEPTPPEKFAAALAALYRAAGEPKYAVLVHQAAQQQPSPVMLSIQSVSDWMRGKAVPANRSAVRFLIAYLDAMATRRGHPVGRGSEWWARLHHEAWEFKQANRGGRPASRTTVSAPANPIHGESPARSGTAEASVPSLTRSLIDAAADLHAALGTTADQARRAALEQLMADLEAVHRDYLKMFESLLDQIPDAWERGTPNFTADVRAAAGRLRRVRLEYEPVRVRVRAAAHAYGSGSFVDPELAFIAAVLAYFPTGELRVGGAGPGTSGTAVLEHLYRSLDGELGQEMGTFVTETLAFHRRRWLQVCQSYAAMQVGWGRTG